VTVLLLLLLLLRLLRCMVLTRRLPQAPLLGCCQWLRWMDAALEQVRPRAATAAAAAFQSGLKGEAGYGYWGLQRLIHYETACQAGHIEHMQHCGSTAVTAAAATTAGKRGPLTQQLQMLYAALVEADVAAGRDAAWDDDS
jgi:hypothetical protein